MKTTQRTALMTAVIVAVALAAAGAATLSIQDNAPKTRGVMRMSEMLRGGISPQAQTGMWGECPPGERFSGGLGGVLEIGACCTLDGCVDVESEDECSTYGGVFFPGETCADGPCGIGACCFPGGCVDTDAYNCIMGGRDFMGAGTACIDDPCDIGYGACCLGDGCEDLSLEDCNLAGGTWVGPGTQCIDGHCEFGACCLSEDECIENQRYQCDALDGEFHAGVDCASDPCVDYGDCPSNSLFAQTKDGPDDNFYGMTSEAGGGLRRYENFTGVAGAIESLLWWGFDLDWDNGWYECEEQDNTFAIVFLTDAGGVPGGVVCSYTLEANRKPTGIYYLGAELNEYSVTLPEPCVLVDGWVSIVGYGNLECWFLWLTSGLGYSYCDNCMPPEQDYDLSICFIGTEGGVWGACCNDLTAQCVDDVEITDCIGENLRFLPDATCEEFEPPCGVVIGACCFEDDTCTIETEEDCTTLGGTWLGKNSICSSCPCITPCPPEGIPEGEPTCYDFYIDEFNGGCLADLQRFSRAYPGQLVCGESGVFDDGYDMEPDFDWYEIEVYEETTLIWSVEAEFRPALWIVDGDEGCPGNVLAHTEDFECAETGVAAYVGPGTYWLVIAPWAWTDSSACGARYTALATLDPYCPADLNGSGTVDIDDLFAVLAAWGPCDPPCREDLDFNGKVDIDDLFAVLGAWGPC